MKPQTPVLATWLLERFGTHNQPLIGDLMEEYRRGRSVLWYWTQVLAAIVVGSLKQLGAHKLLAIRALIVGYASIVAGAWLFMPLNRWILMPWFFSRGWHGHAVLMLQLVSILPASAVYFGAGWIVGRTHRPNSMAMLLPFITLMTCLMLPRVCRLVWDSSTNGRYLPYLAIAVIGLVAMVLAAIWGGLVGSGRVRPAEMRSDAIHIEA